MDVSGLLSTVLTLVLIGMISYFVYRNYQNITKNEQDIFIASKKFDISVDELSKKNKEVAEYTRKTMKEFDNQLSGVSSSISTQTTNLESVKTAIEDLKKTYEDATASLAKKNVTAEKYCFAGKDEKECFTHEMLLGMLNAMVKMIMGVQMLAADVTAIKGQLSKTTTTSP
jgi:archaellum component FlaC